MEAPLARKNTVWTAKDRDKVHEYIFKFLEKSEKLPARGSKVVGPATLFKIAQSSVLVSAKHRNFFGMSEVNNLNAFIYSKVSGATKHAVEIVETRMFPQQEPVQAPTQKNRPSELLLKALDQMLTPDDSLKDELRFLGRLVASTSQSLIDSVQSMSELLKAQSARIETLESMLMEHVTSPKVVQVATVVASSAPISVPPLRITKVPYVCVVGLIGQQVTEIKKQFDKRLAIKCILTENHKNFEDKVRGQVTFLMIGFINHQVESHVKRVAQKMVRVNGGVTDLSRLLEEHLKALNGARACGTSKDLS
jgi:hypothetical protein